MARTDYGMEFPFIGLLMFLQEYGNPFFGGAQIVNIKKVTPERQFIYIISFSLKGPFVAHYRYVDKITNTGHPAKHHGVDIIREDAERSKTEGATIKFYTVKILWMRYVSNPAKSPCSIIRILKSLVIRNYQTPFNQRYPRIINGFFPSFSIFILQIKSNYI